MGDSDECLALAKAPSTQRKRQLWSIALLNNPAILPHKGCTEVCGLSTFAREVRYQIIRWIVYLAKLSPRFF